MGTVGGMGHIIPPYTPGVEIVTFAWSNEHGHCYECGIPAAFFLPKAYVVGDSAPEKPEVHNKRCAICAANAATDGNEVRRIADAQD